MITGICSHPSNLHKLKNYGFAEEVLCKQCWTSLKVKSKEDYVSDIWFKRFLNKIRSWIASGELNSEVEKPDGSIIVVINTFLVRRLAREIGIDEDTFWKYARLLHGYNVDGILEITTMPYDVTMADENERHHHAIRIIPAELECEPWPYRVSDLAIERVECNRVVGPRGFNVKVWLDYYFDEHTQVFIGIGDGTTGEWLGQTTLMLIGGNAPFPCTLTAKTPPTLEDRKLLISCFYTEGDGWVKSDSLELSIKVEDTRTSGLGAATGGLGGLLVGGTIAYALSKSKHPILKHPILNLISVVGGALAGAKAGDGLEYESLISERNKD